MLALRVLVISGLLLSAHASRADSDCKATADTVTAVGASSTNVPATALVKRKEITICNSRENTGTPILKCRTDNTAPVIGKTTPGVAMTPGDCVTFTLEAAKAVKCISDTAATAASAIECRR